MNIAVAPRLTRAAEGLERRRFTVAEVEAMVGAGILDEDERVELIGGELVPMSPAGIRHELVKSALNAYWQRVCPDTCRVTQETTFRLSEDTFLVPEFVIYPRVPGLAGLSGENVLLVVEVADSSLYYDMGRKAGLYASFGVRELWVIDAVRFTTRMFRAPSGAGYLDTLDFTSPETMVPLFAPAEFALALADLELE
jgi:Uma2 family endonuclease